MKSWLMETGFRSISVIDIKRRCRCRVADSAFFVLGITQRMPKYGGELGEFFGPLVI